MQLPKRFIAPNALQGLPDILAQANNGGRRLLLVCDDATWDVAGKQVQEQLSPDHPIDVHRLGTNPHATMEHAKQVISAAHEVDMLLAIGSGTVNDIAKYAASQRKIPYISIATAASMNGYTSPTASLEAAGLKRSYAAHSPLAVVADLNLIAAAPARLARAGYGDVLCRSTVEADMQLAHLLLGTPYPEALFAILRRHEPGLLAAASTLHTPASIALLIEALLDGGDAMAQHGSSAVASQGEHMIAHTLELLYPERTATLFHGELIAVTSLTLARLQQSRLATLPAIITLNHSEEEYTALFGPALAKDLYAAYQRKLLPREQVNRLNETLAYSWMQISQEIAKNMHPPHLLEQAFSAAGLTTTPEDAGFTSQQYQHAVSHAHLTRERFGFLDIAAMNG